MATAASPSAQKPPSPPQTDQKPATENAEQRDKQQDPDEVQRDQREAYEYWGYLFNPDKTGTDKLKSLLRGLKDIMNEQYEPSDQPDLTPTQLAHFYRDLNGNFDQLFLGTPSESIAFIYKSLGCLHSLQPLHHGRSTAFTDPTIPALKTEGWIMWQTIQLLLGPEEHAGFLTEAVQTWDVKDPMTGDTFPKVLPRQCFPMEPDKHMVAWYEGVSERLRREAEAEERQKQIEMEQAEVRRLSERPSEKRHGDPPTDDEGSINSRGPALAYFRNPLYRHVDGRPTIVVQRNSKRPALSPRQTVMVKGKEAASTLGHVVRNVANPHLWDGRGTSGSRNGSRDRRRRSYADDRHQNAALEAPPLATYDDRLSPHAHHMPLPGDPRRRRSSQIDRPGPSNQDDGARDEEDVSPSRNQTGPNDATTGPSHLHSQGPSDSRDPKLRHSRSHEPTPSQNEFGDGYFAGYDDPFRKRNSVAEEKPPDIPPSPAPSFNNVGPSFTPSASPLFASHVARQPQQSRISQPPPRPAPEAHNRNSDSARNPSGRHPHHERHPSRSPDHGGPHRDRRQESSPPRRRHGNSPRPHRDESPSSLHSGPPLGHSWRSDSNGPPHGHGRHPDSRGAPYPPSRDRGSSRASRDNGDDDDPDEDSDPPTPRPRSRSRQKTARFAEPSPSRSRSRSGRRHRHSSNSGR